jgi:hypothetical protein
MAFKTAIASPEANRDNKPIFWPWTELQWDPTQGKSPCVFLND